jgi:hypothetical protein
MELTSGLQMMFLRHGDAVIERKQTTLKEKATERMREK